MSTYWMNIDKPWKNCMVHSEVCRYSRGKRETSLKGIGTIRRDGGWMPFISLEEARTYFDENWHHLGYTFLPCRVCLELQRNRPEFKYSRKPRNEELFRPVMRRGI